MGVTILASVFVFGLLVLFHEFGHCIMAKATGMRVDEFAVGFGPERPNTRFDACRWAASTTLRVWIRRTTTPGNEAIARSRFGNE